MTDAGLPTRLTKLHFHGPLSTHRSLTIARRLTEHATDEYRTVLDLGCGWGATLLQVLTLLPKATGIAVDIEAEDLARGRTNAENARMAHRVDFVEESAVDTKRGPADVVLCVGSSHVLSDHQPPQHTTTALAVLRRLVNPGGRVLFGESIWERQPTPEELSQMWPDASADEHYELPELVELAETAGFRVQWIETANRDEWDQFESGHLADKQEWLAANPEHPEAERIRAEVEQHRNMWLRGYRDVLGFAYLTLVPVA